MRSFGSNLSFTIARVRPRKSRKMVNDEIKSFYEAICSDPVLTHRFSKVPLDTVHTLADEIYDLLTTSWKEGLDEMIALLFELKIMDNIRDLEVDALITHFINEYKGPVDDLATDFWDCLKEENTIVTATSNDIDSNIKNFHKEVTQSPWLRSRFSSIPLTMFAKMMNKVRRGLVSKEVTTEFSNELDRLSKMRITETEFDEFVKLYFMICSAYPEYLSEVWPNVIKIKKAIKFPCFVEQDVTCNSPNIIS